MHPLPQPGNRQSAGGRNLLLRKAYEGQRGPGGLAHGREVVGVAPHNSFLHIKLPALLLLAVAAAGSSEASGPLLAAIKEIPDRGLYERTFTLHQPADVEIEAIGSGWPEEGILFSYAWLLDLGDRSLVWRMLPDEVEESRRDNVEVTERLDLPAGDYAIYFSAFGGLYPIKRKVTLLKMFELGTVDIRGGVPVAWDRYGRPGDWKVTVRAADADFPRDAFTSPAELEDLHALVAHRRVESGEYFRTEVDVREKVRLRVRAIGEYTARDRAFCDGAWIEDLDTCDRIWEMNLVNTKAAGGAKKNRLFDRQIVLSPGRFLFCYAADESHAYGDWNEPPPYDPDSWGLTITPVGELPDGAITVDESPREKNVIARIDRVGDAEFHRIGFRLPEPTEVCVRAFGEWGRNEDRCVDYGWIEDAGTLDEIWTMKYDEGIYASGESRNRLVTDRLELDAGSYYLCYASDYAHAYPDWSNDPPYDPKAWGIQLRGLGEDFDPRAVEHFEEGEGGTALIRLAPMGDSMRRRSRFEIAERTRVRIIALGEGNRGRMYDYGWLEEEETGEVIWEMTYSDTRHAGGGKKNRRADEILTLDPGRYVLHYRTDGSHAFEDWNTAPPDDPHLWGVTLLELQ